MLLDHLNKNNKNLSFLQINQMLIISKANYKIYFLADDGSCWTVAMVLSANDILGCRFSELWLQIYD